MNKTKVAVIGVGSISKQHLEAYKNNPDVEIYALCDINEAQLKKRGEQYGVERLYTDCETMLRELPEIEAVSVCTWNSAHAPCTIAALKAGKHVLCEKPMATNAKDAEAMLQAAKELQEKEAAEAAASADPEIDALVAQRTEAKKAKNWAEADRIRDELKARGIEIIDTPQGAKWRRI